MCLLTKDPTVKVAENDIVVYKYLGVETRRRKWWQVLLLYKRPRVFRAFHYNFHEYKINEAQPTVSIEPESYPYDGNTWVVHKGYHSDRVYKEYNSNAEFVIPKGTKYIEGQYNDEPNRPNYVSETIIFKRFCAGL